MSEETLIRHCAPTLAGIKTGNLFRCPYPDRREMIEDVRRWNTALSPKGLRLIPLQYDKGSAMIYLFRPARLQADLNDDMACALLQARGYATQTCSRCIVSLMDRLRQSDEFPHEIGLFLGYPPEDVSAFMEHRDTGCKCVGSGRSTATKRPPARPSTGTKSAPTPTIGNGRRASPSTG